MKNPFKHFFKSKGLPDSAIHHGVSGSSPPPTSQSLVPVGYPTAGGAVSSDNQASVVDPPTAYPYVPQQEAEVAEAAWEFNAGNNVNKQGHQKTGHISVGNTNNAAVLPIKLPQNRRFVFNAGGNTNEGGWQDVGGIEFANVRR
ncbi:hypothetical protein RND81_11G168200 [Saponaria officinalis]|uniref:Uncharacterized protein n=1 Tax=Saponaria officinalis TaxID=3572 RepID=A0AAW1HN34_SAPOF